MLVLAGVLLYFAFRKIAWSDFVEGLGSCNWFWIGGAVLSGFLAILVRGWRWKIMLHSIAPNLTRSECYHAYAVCYFANLAVPRSGEIVRCGMLANTHKISFEGAMGSMVLERVWDLVFSTLIAVCMVIFSRFGTFLIEKMWTPFVERFSFNAFWLLIGFLIVCAAVFLFLMKSKAGGRIYGFFKGLADGVKAGFRMPHKGRFFIQTIFIWACYWAESLCIIYAYPAMDGLGAMDALLIMIIGSIGWLVPVQGGFGAYHLLVSVALVPIYGISQQTGLIFATISHETQVITMIVLGIISLAHIAISKRHRAD